MARLPFAKILWAKSPASNHLFFSLQILPSAALSDNPDLHNSPDGIQVI